MTGRLDVERVLDAFLAPDSDQLPDRVIEASLSEIARTPQRRALRAPWRIQHMLVSRATAMVGAALLVAIAVGGIALLATAPRTGSPAMPTPTPTSQPSPVAGSTTFDTATISAEFPLAMTVTVPPGWRIDHGNPKLSLGLINVGDPPAAEDQWWGPEVWLVDGALVHDPADVVSDQPATADKARFIPWPSDYIAYLTGLPGTNVVAGPRPVTVGGVVGTEVIVDTPAMHPTTWLAGDFTWMGGGPNGVDPPARRHEILLTVGTAHLLLGFGDAPAAFDARDATVQGIFRTITFAP